MANKDHLRDSLFHIGILLKGLDGALEVIGAIALWVMSPGRLIRIVYLLTQSEIAKDPHDRIATHLRHAAANFSFSTEHFMSFYLFGHGIVKLFLVVALLKRQVWAFPTSIVIFGGFVLYEIYRFTLTHSIGLILFAAIDMAVIWFIWVEYRSMRKKQSAA